ncbi:MAG: Na+/H+ antiporter subunit E [Bacteroidales bacterium]|jgi:multisubunit Na+/H+ antiporter MnhE subunit|nr:Na+/H+ antiporter subunit E [Bacteroidales bacterium]
MKIIQSFKATLFRLSNLFFLFFYFSYKVIHSGWVVGWLVIRGYQGEHEGIIEYHPQSEKPWHIILLFNLISMTPGSLSVDLSSDHQTIYVHLLNSRDQQSFMDTTQKIEKMLLKSFNNQQQENKIHRS